MSNYVRHYCLEAFRKLRYLQLLGAVTDAKHSVDGSSGGMKAAQRRHAVAQRAQFVQRMRAAFAAQLRCLHGAGWTGNTPDVAHNVARNVAQNGERLG
ncbi:hypothetical protein GCM10027093_66610 [Paraburkholderia jirisanensis]